MKDPLILTIIMFASYIGGRTFTKISSNLVVGRSLAGLMLYNLINGIVACGFFFVSGGFSVSINLPTAIYAMLYAVLAGLSAISLIGYKIINVSKFVLITTSSSIFATSITGAIVFKEELSLRTVLRIVIMMAAVCISFLDKDKGQEENKPLTAKKTITLILVVLVSLFISVCVTILTKFYTLDSRVLDENSWFFFTNVFLIAFSAVILSVYYLKDRAGVKDSLAILKPKKICLLMGNTVCSNVTSLVGVYLLAVTSVSVYTPLTSALALIAGLVVSLLFREKLGFFSYVAVAVAAVSVVLAK